MLHSCRLTHIRTNRFDKGMQLARAVTVLRSAYVTHWRQAVPVSTTGSEGAIGFGRLPVSHSPHEASRWNAVDANCACSMQTIFNHYVLNTHEMLCLGALRYEKIEELISIWKVVPSLMMSWSHVTLDVLAFYKWDWCVWGVPYISFGVGWHKPLWNGASYSTTRWLCCHSAPTSIYIISDRYIASLQ